MRGYCGNVRIELEKEVASFWNKNDIFQALSDMEGEVFKDKDDRRTLRFEKNGSRYFLKYHGGIGWGEILKNIWQFKLPVLGAENEWKAIRFVRNLGLDTLTVVGFGSRGFSPASQESFLLTKELPETLSLEKIIARWPESPPSPSFKATIVEKLAEISGVMHRAGINHRDLYACHFLVDVQMGLERLDEENLKMHVVDLHRAQIRDRVPERWKIKDLASLFFSMMDANLTRGDLCRFMKTYSRKSLRQTLVEDQVFWLKVEKRALRMYEKLSKKAPPETSGRIGRDR